MVAPKSIQVVVLWELDEVFDGSKNLGESFLLFWARQNAFRMLGYWNPKTYFPKNGFML